MSFKERRFWTCHNFHRSHSLCLSHKHMIIDHSTEAPIILKELRIRSWPGLKTHVHETTLVDLIRLHWRRCREVEFNSICPRTIFQLYNCTVIYSDLHPINIQRNPPVWVWDMFYHSHLGEVDQIVFSVVWCSFLNKGQVRQVHPQIRDTRRVTADGRQTNKINNLLKNKKE